MDIKAGKDDIYICLPVHNEEKTLDKCLYSIKEAMSLVPNCVFHTFICLNGCHDKSDFVANLCKAKYSILNIEIIKSKKGKLNAQTKVVSKIPPNKKIFFIDADTEIAKDSISILLKEFKKHNTLIAVGSFPVAKYYVGTNPWRKVLDKILNIRSRHPICEISCNNVDKYHQLARKDPQNKNTNLQHELRSKIFFHGRMFAIKSKKYWNKPPVKTGVVGDDSYLPDYINYYYGPGKIRIRYDSIVYFNPFVSLIGHYNSYKRIFYDLKNLKKSFPEFKQIREDSKLMLDNNYIKNQKYKTRICFSMFSIFRKIETQIFKWSIEKDPNKIWKKS